MKRTLLIILLLLLTAVVPARLNAGVLSDMPEMGNYCSAPPYVTRNVIPNIMVLMDNSPDMYNPAYTDAYTPNATIDNYIGYFKPQSCYAYSGSTFAEVAKTGNSNCSTPSCYTSYTAVDTCPSTAPFRGNLLNWATTSKYDLLQKVLVGGNSVSKQGNANTLLSISGSWSKTYNNCVFAVANATLIVTENTPGLCALLDNPAPSGFAFLDSPWYRSFSGWVAGRFNALVAFVSLPFKELVVIASDAWEKLHVIAEAWAAPSTAGVGINTGSVSGYLGYPYSITFQCTGSGSACPNGTYTWTVSNLPAWLTISYSSSSSHSINDLMTLSGTPTAAANSNITVSFTVGSTSASKAYTLSFTPAPLNITATALPTARVGMAYSTTIGGQGGKTCGTTSPWAWAWNWSATGLPAGLSINSSTGEITGTPTTNSGSPYNVTVTMIDCSTPANSISKTFSLTVNSSTLAVSTAGLPSGIVSSPYSSTLAASGGTGTGYTWAITSGYLPFGLFLNPSTGVISGTTCPFTSNGALSGVMGNSGSTCLKTDAFGFRANTNYTVSACPSAGGNFTGDTWLNLIGPGGYTAMSDDSDCGGTWMLASTLSFNLASNGTMTLCESAYGAHEYGTGLYPTDTTWSYTVTDTDANRSCQGTFPFTVSLTDTTGTTVTQALSITINPNVLAVATTALYDATKGIPYTYTLAAVGGTGPYTWTVTGLPASFSYDSSMGVIYGTAASNEIGSYNLTVTVTDSLGAAVSKALTLNVVRASAVRSQTFNVKVTIYEEVLVNDAVSQGGNGNDIYDSTYPAESYVDSNGNGVWDGKEGIFHQFWDQVKPRARWGLSDYINQGASELLKVEACIPASPAASYFTSVQNATAANNPAPLASGLYGDINYFIHSSASFSNFSSSSFSGCTSAQADPMDPLVPCRKNFVLVISSGSDVTSGSAFPANTAGCSQSNKLVQNACVGQGADLRAEAAMAGKQTVYTYILNTMGTNTTNNAILQAAAAAGAGKYYVANQGTDLAAQLKNAINDILGKAASGTAVSVLTTSSRGIGSMVQAYFLATEKAGPTETREVTWTGYLQNLWIDPQNNLREDTINDLQLKLDQDNVVKFYFDTNSNSTKAATFTTDANGMNGTLGSCNPTVEDFSLVKYLWEAGKKLAYTYPNERTLFTSSKIVQGSSTAYTFSPYDFTASTITGNSTLKAALNPDADGTSFSAANIIAYTRGECLETGSSGDADCGSVPNGIYRDRRVELSGTLTNYNSGLQKPTPGSDGNVWKLGDIISSTPKVFANTPLNTYHIQYGDQTYIQFVSDTTTATSYGRHSSIAFVGANDGFLHAFRVGFLVDSGLSSGVKALFQNFFNDTAKSQVGDEVWGYVPFNALPYLKYLANPGYCHVYFNDLSVRLVDASIGSDTDLATDTKTQSSWRTILIGGMRFGGACSAVTGTGLATSATPTAPYGDLVGLSAYYAIDITNPESPQPMWEFTDRDLGFTTSYPGIIRTGSASNNGNWYVSFGSGSDIQPKNDTDIGRVTTGYVYILDLKTGALVKKIGLDHAGIVGDVLAVDADQNYVSEKLYFGTAYNTSGTWKGKLADIPIPDQDLSSSWTPTVVNLIADNYPFTASPDAAKDDAGKVWVFQGSGKYYSDVDDSDTSNQVFLGVKDDSSIAYPRAVASLTDTTTVTVTGTVAETTKQCLMSGSTWTLADVVTSINPTSPDPSAQPIGWYIRLSGGERVISRPLAVAGLVDFLSYVPDSSPCAYGGNSNLYSLGYNTGVAPNTTLSIIAAATTGGVVTKGATVSVRNHIDLGPGAPPTGEAIIIPPGTALKKKIQVATGVIVEAEDQGIVSVFSGIVHWLKK